MSLNRALLLPILCYHKVSDAPEDGRWLNVSTQTLRAHVRFFARRGYRFALSDELAKGIPAHSVCLTFDDCYASTMANAPAILSDLGAKGIFFAVPGRVGGTSDWDGDRAAPLAGWSGLELAAAKGMEIANHTMNHIHLNEADVAEQNAEIAEAKQELAARGFGSVGFCYPYGHYNQDSLAALRAQGYKVAYAVAKRPATEVDPRLELPRIVIAYSDNLAKLLYKIFLRPKLP